MTVAELIDVSREYRGLLALDRVSLTVRAGEVHALLGPNGAGKTTLLRLLTGLLDPNGGQLRVLGREDAPAGHRFRGRVGLVPSGDRTFYLRISGLENLLFFGRLYGMRRPAAAARALEVLADVGLEHAAHRPVNQYSHGMQKRLSLARALLTDPKLLLVDEATHDLDPEGAQQARDLIRREAERGAGVLFTTQRVEEIRGFADRVTLLSHGRVRFTGTVPELMSHATPQRFLVRLRMNGSADAAGALGSLGTISTLPGEGTEHYLLSLRDGVPLGDAIAALTGARVDVLACREERPEIEDAFLSLTREPGP